MKISELNQHSLTLKQPYLIQVHSLSVLPKQASKVISLFSQDYPLSNYNLSHIKRARKSPCSSHISVIIAPIEEIPDLSAFDKYSTDCSTCLKYQQVQVPSIPPYNKVQLVQWAKYWPCTLVQPLVPPYIHSESEINSIEPLFNQLRPGICFLLIPETGYVVMGEDGAESWKHCTLQCINEYQVNDGDYLCSKAVALLFDEPCIMCAMALVHSRVRMVYFVKDREDGAFSMHKLHKRALNYMYRVFRLEKEKEKEKNVNDEEEKKEIEEEQKEIEEEKGSNDAR